MLAGGGARAGRRGRAGWEARARRRDEISGGRRAVGGPQGGARVGRGWGRGRLGSGGGGHAGEEAAGGGARRKETAAAVGEVGGAGGVRGRFGDRGQCEKEGGSVGCGGVGLRK